MAFVHSKQGRVLVNDKHLSGRINGWTVAGERNLGETTTLLDDGARFIPGLRAGSINVTGLFDGEDGDIDETIQATDGALDGLLTTVLPDGFTIGKPAFIATSNLSSYTVESSVSDTVSLTVETTPNDGVDHGRVVHAHTAETATGNTATSVDNGASSLNGGVASLHVTAASGTTPSLTVKVQHSVDGNTFVDLITFSAATAAGSQRRTVAGTVNRYVRETHTISGTTPSFTYAAAFARR
ncbi:hypothetical protein [Nonomuraea gerenzanensis]|uniref:Uncharacterized protein n=1 Tax=Nonomuraea gerenzanensis TaxID=93944 RepID=A0A1M4EMN2_9ACTN|nr:hypothetical protein [Nonomuraea gerenzanensis]UBU11603.1 hypothetical protein LCN96_46075 [Nonomuraea gerenzanensis]SBP00099.1 hypothetical protein BN4615_P9615 [Nonomuraea gerenzanensis]